MKQHKANCALCELLVHLRVLRKEGLLALKNRNSDMMNGKNHVAP